MATLVLGALGTLVGGPLGGAIGATLGRSLDAGIIGSPRREGPRLKELAVSTSSYGSAIPALYGRVRVPGTIIWAPALEAAPSMPDITASAIILIIRNWRSRRRKSSGENHCQRRVVTMKSVLQPVWRS